MEWIIWQSDKRLEKGEVSSKIRVGLFGYVSGSQTVLLQPLAGWTEAFDAEIVSVSSHLPEKMKLTEFFVLHFLCNLYIKQHSCLGILGYYYHDGFYGM